MGIIQHSNIIFNSFNLSIYFIIISMFPAGPKKKLCSICRIQIEPLDEKIMIERHNVHKKCFNCAICETPLIGGRCALDDVLYPQFGPMWFCPAHMMLGSGEKYELLKSQGKVRKEKRHIAQEFIATAEKNNAGGQS